MKSLEQSRLEEKGKEQSTTPKPNNHSVLAVFQRKHLWHVFTIFPFDSRLFVVGRLFSRFFSGSGDNMFSSQNF